MLKLFNSASKKKEIFKPLKPPIVSIYSCGPTVYSYQHIGNMRAALCFDFLKRTLRLLGYTIKDVMNITDVGHLTDDTHDQGDDKMVAASKKEKKSPQELADFYTQHYLNDLQRLHVVLPKHMPKATEYIQEQIEMIKALEANGYTYLTDDGIYFDTQKFSAYGMLSKKADDDDMKSTRTILHTTKKHPHDFALWKFLTQQNTHHLMKWESPWGVGFPGWHIECSAMAFSILGKQFDIHTGGIEHKAIHHENEIAQNVCSGCIDTINFWLHNAHLINNSEKMSKSLGNIILVQDLVDKHYHPLALRELCLRTHYRKQLNFTYTSLKSAQSSLMKIYHFDHFLHTTKATQQHTDPLFIDTIHKALEEFKNALCDDINTPQALGIFYEFISTVYKHERFSAEEFQLIQNTYKQMQSVLGLDNIYTHITLTPEQEIIIEARNKARSNKDWNTADKLRSKLQEDNYTVIDTERGTLLIPKKTSLR